MYVKSREQQITTPYPRMYPEVMGPQNLAPSLSFPKRRLPKKKKATYKDLITFLTLPNFSIP